MNKNIIGYLVIIFSVNTSWAQEFPTTLTIAKVPHDSSNTKREESIDPVSGRTVSETNACIEDLLIANLIGSTDAKIRELCSNHNRDDYNCGARYLMSRMVGDFTSTIDSLEDWIVRCERNLNFR